MRVGLDAPRSAAVRTPLPFATALARWQATQKTGITNRRHEHLKLSDLTAAFSRGSTAARPHRPRRSLRQAIGRGEFKIRREGEMLRELDDATVTRILDHTLADLGKKSLLAG